MKGLIISECKLVFFACVFLLHMWLFIAECTNIYLDKMILVGYQVWEQIAYPVLEPWMCQNVPKLSQNHERVVRWVHNLPGAAKQPLFFLLPGLCVGSLLWLHTVRSTCDQSTSLCELSPVHNLSLLVKLPAKVKLVHQCISMLCCVLFFPSLDGPCTCFNRRRHSLTGAIILPSCDLQSPFFSFPTHCVRRGQPPSESVSNPPLSVPDVPALAVASSVWSHSLQPFLLQRLPHCFQLQSSNSALVSFTLHDCHCSGQAHSIHQIFQMFSVSHRCISGCEKILRSHCGPSTCTASCP